MQSADLALRRVSWLLGGAAALFLAVWQAPVINTMQGLANYLPLHMFAETFSIVISMLVFGVAWNAYSAGRPGNTLILACAFFSVGLIDFAHMLSFKGMPDFVTPADPEKAINLWLVARLAAALALLTVAVRPWRPLDHPQSRYALLAGCVAVTGAIVWLGLAYPHDWPHTFIAGRGLTPFKIGAEYAIIAVLIVPAILFYRSGRRKPHYDAASLFAATALTILSELCFTLYSDVTDMFNLLGHLYKIAAYAFIYRAMFIASVAEPFRRLDAELEEKLRIEEALRRYKDHLEEEVQERTAALVLARNAAEAANKAKSVFLANMSHELRTPLNAILGFSAMMRKDPLLTGEQRENLDIINRSGEHLLTLINDVLEMAKVEAGRVELESAPFDLGRMVRDVTDMMHVRAQEKGLRLLVDQASQFPRYIRGDEARLRQILINLVGNAIKFTQQGGVTVRLGTVPGAPQQRLRIEVEDSGIGIRAEDQQKIFEPFVQVGQAATQKGTGLGLTITRQFVQLMGGTIGVESTPGTGSVFRIELPVERATEADVTKPASTGKGDIAGLAPGQPEYRILVVEDQLENQLLLTRLMSNVGFKVRVAENGVQGVEAFRSWHPHLIWMDRRMPVMDGLEAMRRIRQFPGGREVKIVAVTASAFAEQRNEMLNAGMDDFVRKPYRFDEIYECLSKQLGVKYVYAGAPAAEEERDLTLTADMLAALPPELRRELRDALQSLDMERIKACVQEVAACDAALHKTLAHLAANFDYPAMLRALQTD